MANWKIDKNLWIYDKENNWEPLIPLKKVGIGFAKTSKFAFNCNKSDRIELQQKLIGLKCNFQNASVFRISFWELSFELSEKFNKCEKCSITKLINH